MSERKPGVSSSAPPKITSTPSATSRAGHAAGRGRASLKRRQAARPCERISSEPSMESAISSAIVHQTPIAWPTWMITASSAIGTTMNSDDEQEGHAPGRLRARGQARLTGGEHGRRGCGTITSTDGSRCSPTSSISVPDVRLRVASESVHPVRAQPLGEAREVDHQRRVGERQLGQVDDHVARRLEGRGDGSPAAAARRAVLVPRDAQDPELFVERDDGREPRQTGG